MASNRQIELLASAWLARRDSGEWSERDQRALDAWLQESTARRVAYLRLQAAWRQSGRLKALGAGVPAGVIPERAKWGVPSTASCDAALEDVADRRTEPHTHLIASQHDIPRHFKHPASVQGRSRFFRYGTVACVALVLGLFAIGWQHYAAVDRASYRTAIGGLQDIPLPDGSVITLSSDSRVTVRFSRSERRIDLLQGEAFFKVAKDAERPFVVGAGDHRAIAVGTRYDVRRDAGDLRVIVTRGVVRLESDNGPGGRRQPTTLLPAGSIALATDSSVAVSSVPVQQAEELVSWRSGFISLHDTPLAAAVAEFNRYNQRRIVIGDASIGTLRVGGNFRWSNADSFVRLLELGFPVRAVRSENMIVLKRR